MRQNKALPVRRWLSAVVISAVAATAGCSLFGSDSKSAESVEQKIGKDVWHMRDMFVRLEAQDKAKGAAVAPNQHPVNITQEQLSNALSQITVKTDDKTGYLPLFTEFELGVLSKNVSDGLAEARADQDVTFAVIGWHKGGGVFSMSEQQVTTGRIFYQNGQVNLIVGAAHRSVDTGENYATQAATSGDRRLDPFVPGMRSFTQPHKWQIAAAPSSGVYTAPGGQRSDWLVFSAQALAAVPPPALGRPAANNAAEQARYEQLQKQVDQLQQQLKGMQQNQPAGAYPAQPVQPAQPAYPGYQYPAAPGYPAQPAYPGYQYPANPQPGYYGSAAPAPQAAPATQPGQSPSGGTSPEQRLMVLDDLKSKGLISDDEYQQRRSEILSGR